MAVQFKWTVHQADVKRPFLNGDLEEVYMQEPRDFMQKWKENLVFKLKKALYGLKEAIRASYAKIEDD